MRTLGILALAGVGLGMFLRTERGKQMLSQAKTAMNEGKDRFTTAIEQRGGPEKMIQSALKTDRPDTTMAQAFEEAIAA